MTLRLKFTYYSGELELSLLNSKDIINMAVMPVTQKGFYDKETHEIFPNGPLDLRLVIFIILKRDSKYILLVIRVCLIVKTHVKLV